jgi:hypothetical protein
VAAKRERLAGRRIPGSHRDTEPLMQSRPELPSGSLVAAKPPADDAVGHGELARQNGKRERIPAHCFPEQARSLAQILPTIADEESRSGHPLAPCRDMTTFASTNLDHRAKLVGEDAHVAGSRGERWARDAELAGQRLTLAKKELGISFDRLSELTGSHKSQLSRLFAGLLPEASVGMFFDVCDALGLDPVYVWRGRPMARMASPPPPASGDRTSKPPRR